MRDVSDEVNQMIQKDNDPFEQVVQDISSIVLPTLLFSVAGSTGLAARTSSVPLTSTQRLVGDIALDLGVSAGVTGLSRQSVEDESLTELASKLSEKTYWI